MDTRVFYGADSLAHARGPSVVAIGNFDGVHLGHQALIRLALATAEQRGLTALALTFHPHPYEVLVGPGHTVLTPLARKLDLLQRIDPRLMVVVERFTRELGALSPREFVERVLVGRLRSEVVVVGQGFRFGHGRQGDLQALRSLGQELGLSVIPAQLVSSDSEPVSSSRIRAVIVQGDLKSAARDLTRPHSLSGRVVHGDGRGRLLGVPTANLSRTEELLPPHGVYACLVDQRDADGRGRALGCGVLNLGVRPTLEAGFGLEVHVLDYTGDLYGAFLRVHLLERLREERRFADVAELSGQIQRDLEHARGLCADYRPDPAAGGAWH